MTSQNVIPANSDKPCACCGRIHRKLFLIDGYWLGQNCAEQYKIYKSDKNINSFVWRGWERQYNKIARMVGAQ